VAQQENALPVGLVPYARGLIYGLMLLAIMMVNYLYAGDTRKKIKTQF